MAAPQPRATPRHPHPLRTFIQLHPQAQIRRVRSSFVKFSFVEMIVRVSLSHSKYFSKVCLSIKILFALGK
jgi:hypothetical protein